MASVGGVDVSGEAFTPGFFALLPMHDPSTWADPRPVIDTNTWRRSGQSNHRLTFGSERKRTWADKVEVAMIVCVDVLDVPCRQMLTR